MTVRLFNVTSASCRIGIRIWSLAKLLTCLFDSNWPDAMEGLPSANEGDPGMLESI